MKFSKVARNAKTPVDLLALAEDGYVRIYSGSPPAKPETAPGETLLVELRLRTPAFTPVPDPAPAPGPVSVARAYSLGHAPAVGKGAAGWFRVLQSDGKTALLDGTVGLAGAELNLNVVELQVGTVVAASGLAIGYPLAKEEKEAKEKEKE